jgi:hypothetical protein
MFKGKSVSESAFTAVGHECVTSFEETRLVANVKIDWQAISSFEWVVNCLLVLPRQL